MSRLIAGWIAASDEVDPASRCVCLDLTVLLPLLCLLFEEPRLRNECSEMALRTLRTADSTENPATRGPRVGRQAATILREASMILQYKVGTIRSVEVSAPIHRDAKDYVAGLQATSGSVWDPVPCQIM